MEMNQRIRNLSFIAPITPPELREWSRRAVEEFLQKYKQYALEMREVKMLARKMTLCVDVALQNSLAQVKFEKNTWGDVSELELQEALEDMAQKAKTTWYTSLEQKLERELSVNLSIEDCEARAFKFFQDFQQLINGHDLERLIAENPKKGWKQASDLLIKQLRPQRVKDMVANKLMTLEGKACRESASKLVKLIEECMQICEDVHLLDRQAKDKFKRQDPKRESRFRVKQDSKETPSWDRKSAFKTSERRFKGQEGMPSRRSGFQKRQVAQNHFRSYERRNNGNRFSWRKKEEGGSAEQSKLACFLCGGEHFRRDCPQAENASRKWNVKRISGEDNKFERRVAKKQRTSNFGASNGQKSEIKSNKKAFNKHSRGLYAYLGLQVPVDVCADSGADENLVSRKMVRHVQERNAPILLNMLGERRVLCLADGVGTLTVIAQVTLDVKLQTKKGPLTLRDVTCLVTMEDLPEMILGQPALLDAGVDVVQMLEDLALEQVEMFSDEEEMMIRRVMEQETPLDMLSSARAGEIPVDHPDFGDDLEDRLCEVGNGYNDPEELCKALDNLVGEARSNGLTLHEAQQLQELLEEFKDVFRVTLGKDPPVKVEPMQVGLNTLCQGGIKPVKVPTRRYSYVHRRFMQEETERQIALGLARRNSHSEWASAPFCVPKKVVEGQPLPPLIDQFRMTIDLRAVNQLTTSTAWPMPNLEVALNELQGATCFAKFDLVSGYWQFPLDPSCQEYFSFMTDREVFTPTRVPQGATGSVAYVQKSMCYIIGEDLLYRSVIPWLDDVLLWAASVHGLLRAVRLFLLRCRKFGLKLHARKSQAFAKEVIWCGRRLSAHGVSVDPTKLVALRKLPMPTTGRELQQFVCAMNWLRGHFVDYAPVIAPLESFLQKIYRLAGGCRKSRLKSVSLMKSGWNTDMNNAWEAVKKLIEQEVTLAFAREHWVVSVFTDASDGHWGAICTQIPREDEALPVHKQRHELLAVLSYPFHGAQLRWAIVEKEAYALVATCMRLEYLLLREGGFKLYTDHRNLSFIFGKGKADGVLRKHTAAKLQRWSLILRAFQYEIVYLEGEQNVWADLLSRFVPETQLEEKLRVDDIPAIRRALLVPVSQTKSSSFVWPREDDIRKVQRSAEKKNVKEIECGHDGIWRTKKGTIWIPHDAKEVQARLMVIAHSGAAGHRAYEASLVLLEQVVWWQTIKQDLAEFINTCLHCLAMTGPHKVPRPIGMQMHATKPNEILHLDYLYIRAHPDENEPQYIHVAKDDMSSFVLLTPVRSPNAEGVVEALTKWGSLFTLPRIWVSDGGSHYQNKIMEGLREQLHVQHHITVAYAPWSNGTVESMMKQILRVFRAICSEFRYTFSHWKELVPVVQAALNLAPSQKLGMRSPAQVFLGFKPTYPIATILPPALQEITSLSEVTEKIETELKELEKARDLLHKEVAETAEKARASERARVNKKRGIKVPNYHIGDYVLVAKPTGQHRGREKLSLRWQGPRQITKALNDWVYEVKHLTNKNVEKVHASRLKLFSEKDLGIDVDLLDQAAYNDDCYYVECIEGLKQDKDASVGFRVLVKWEGFPEDENSWEPIKQIVNADFPAVKAFIESGKCALLARRAKAWLKKGKKWQQYEEDSD